METQPPFDPNKTQEFKVQRRAPEETQTKEYHPDIMQFVDILNWETYTLMGDDGFIRAGLKVKALDMYNGTWMVTLFDPEHPESANDTLTMTLGAFDKQRQRTVLDAAPLPSSE